MITLTIRRMVVWLRRFIVFLLSLVLLVALCAASIALSFDAAFDKPTQLKTWLDQSGVYQAFTSSIVARAPQTATVTIDNQTITIPIDSSLVQQAAQNAFPTSLLKQDFDSFIDANYAWLKGETPQPVFQSDVSSEKNSFAQAIGSEVQKQLGALPTCTLKQLEQYSGSLSIIDTLCLPPGVNPTTQAQEAIEQIEDNSDFLSNPVLTPASFNLSGTTSSHPYYERLHWAPHAYQFMIKLPWLAAIVAILCTAGIVFVAVSRRRGARRAAWIFIIAGVVLLLLRLTSNMLFSGMQNSILNAASAENAQLHTSLLTVLGHIENTMTQVDQQFGIAYLVAAVVILLALLFTRRKTKTKTVPAPQPATAVQHQAEQAVASSKHND